MGGAASTLAKKKDTCRAFMTAAHPRLGQESPAAIVDDDLRKFICKLSILEPHAELPSTIYEPVYGFKAFNKDMTCCDGFQYAVGCTYEIRPWTLEMCNNGFHFCRLSMDVLKYYSRAKDNVYARVRADVLVYDDGNKSVCSQITVLELVSYEQLTQSMPNKVVRVDDGLTENYKDGVLSNGPHGEPAITGPDGAQGFVDGDGNLHNDDGPALSCAEKGYQYWYKHGKIDRAESEGPALITRNQWCFYKGNVPHREHGPAECEMYDTAGPRYTYFCCGLVHRPVSEGPAVIMEGLEVYCERNRPHRPVKDGPAFVWKHPAWAKGKNLHWEPYPVESFMIMWPAFVVRFNDEPEESFYAEHGKRVNVPQEVL